MDGYTELAAAIVERALQDYKTAAEHIKRKYNTTEAERTIHDVSKFLKSEWFAMLSDLNGKLLLKMMKEEVA